MAEGEACCLARARLRAFVQEKGTCCSRNIKPDRVITPEDMKTACCAVQARARALVKGGTNCCAMADKQAKQEEDELYQIALGVDARSREAKLSRRIKDLEAEICRIKDIYVNPNAAGKDGRTKSKKRAQTRARARARKEAEKLMATEEAEGYTTSPFHGRSPITQEGKARGSRNGPITQGTSHHG